MSPVELKKARPNKNKFKKNNANTTKFFKPSKKKKKKKKIYFKEYKNEKVGWKEGIIEKQIGRLVYIIKTSQIDC